MNRKNSRAQSIALLVLGLILLVVGCFSHPYAVNEATLVPAHTMTYGDIMEDSEHAYFQDEAKKFQLTVVGDEEKGYQLQSLELKKKDAAPTAAIIYLTLDEKNAMDCWQAMDPSSANMTFAMLFIAGILGVLLICCGIHGMTRKETLSGSARIHTMVMAAMFAALCYIGFSFFRIDIPVGTEKTAFHLGNVFCVLAALLIGGFWGGMSGAVGMTIADLTTGYVTSAPKTFILKLCIGLIAGLVAHKVFHMNRDDRKKGNLVLQTVLSAAAGMAFNVVADPVVGYFYKTYVLGVPQDAAKIWAKIGAVTTLVNAIVAVVVATVLYLAIRPAMKKAGLFQKMAK